MQVAVTAHPYAYQQDTIEVPDDLTTEEEIRTYIEGNLDQVDFQEPDLDYIGTDFEIDFEAEREQDAER